MNDVDIKLGGSSSVKTNGGSFMFKNQIKNPAVFKDWLFVYSYGKNQNYDDKDADSAFDLMRKSS